MMGEDYLARAFLRAAKMFNLLPKQSVPFLVGMGAALGNVAASCNTRPELTTLLPKQARDVAAALRCC